MKYLVWIVLIINIEYMFTQIPTTQTLTFWTVKVCVTHVPRSEKISPQKLSIVASAVPQVDDRAMVIPNTHEVELDYQISTTPEQILHT